MLDVSTTAADQVNSLGSELGHSRLTTHLEFSLLDVDHNLSSGQTTLMARITANTYTTIRITLQSTNPKTNLPIFQIRKYKR